jgi:hypothetical protein
MFDFNGAALLPNLRYTTKFYCLDAPHQHLGVTAIGDYYKCNSSDPDICKLTSKQRGSFAVVAGGSDFKLEEYSCFLKRGSKKEGPISSESGQQQRTD